MRLSEEDDTNKTRRMLQNYISSHPGATIGILKKIFQISIGNLRYHLDVLERQGKITHKKKKKIKKYYSVGPDREMSKVQRKLVYVMKNRPGIGQKELIIKTKLERHIVKYNIKKLNELDIIHVEKKGKNRFYYYMSETEYKYNKEHLALVARYLRKKIDLETYMVKKTKLDKKYNVSKL